MIVDFANERMSVNPKQRGQNSVPLLHSFISLFFLSPGHRFMAPDAIEVSNFAQYKSKLLKKAYVHIVLGAETTYGKN